MLALVLIACVSGVLVYINLNNTKREIETETGNKEQRNSMIICMHISSVIFYFDSSTEHFQVDGIRVAAGYSDSLHRFTVNIHGNFIRLVTTFGLRVDFDGRSRASIQVPSSYRNKIEGICADFDGNGDNDYIMQGGRNVKNERKRYSLIGNSWKVDDPDIPE